MARLLQWIGFLTGLGGLVLQLALTIPASLEAGRSIAGSIVFFFSFFTVLTNILVMLAHAAALGLAGNRLSLLQHPSIRAGLVAAIAMVGLVYFFILAALWQPAGWWQAADITLHYVTPLVFVGWWLIAGRGGTSTWRDPFVWLAWPLGYLAYALARAPIAGEVPYPFLNYMENGWGAVLSAITGLLVLYLSLGFAIVALDRFLPAVQSQKLRDSSR
ncbi:Pr6Pr family membrane protein [Salaquimonas pukyongi]|uniref:Pr6Pr family membrane protein n=1 Tax=Salaquimonas pukyongi TaxID=2712698 RepID=UPI00096B76A8|nr:Pr6Pr family membrane protein [Salaquimonas pukyongi]